MADQKQPKPIGGNSSNVGNPKHDGRNGCQIAGSNETPVFGCEEGRNSTIQSSGTGDTGIVSSGVVADAQRLGRQGQGEMGEPMHPAQSGDWETDKSICDSAGFWHDHDWIICGDNKARRIPTTQSGICIVGYGIQHRAPLLHAFGNAIVPPLAKKFIEAYMSI
jgi:hypothetical protein